MRRRDQDERVERDQRVEHGGPRDDRERTVTKRAARERAIVAILVAALTGCGGSGSTGLISPEGALLQTAREEGTCVSSAEMVTYCATNAPSAVSPDGAHASGPFPSPVRTTTPAAAVTPTPGGGGG